MVTLEVRIREAMMKEVPPTDETIKRVIGVILERVLMPEYRRWRDVDGEIGIGASGALSNVICRLTGLIPLEKINDA